MMKIMALQVLRELAQNIQSADFYSIMGDEATHVSNVLQLVICLRWIDCDLVAHDEFIGFKEIPCTNADSIVAELEDVLLRMNLKLNKSRGQCYDGYSTMTVIETKLLSRSRRKRNELFTLTVTPTH